MELGEPLVIAMFTALDGERNLNPTYYAAAGAPRTLWRVPGSGHVGGIDAQPKQYERRVVAFFDRALFGER